MENSRVAAKPLDERFEMIDPVKEATEMLDPGRDTMEGRALALRIASEADPGIAPFSYRMVKFVLMALVVCICGGDSGFDGTVMSSVNSMSQFQSYFNIQAATATSLVFGIYTVGAVCSAFVLMFLPDKYGRRKAMFVGNVILIGGALCSGFGVNFSTFIAGRWLVGFGSGIAGSAAKSYMAEIAPTASRGRWLGLLNSFYFCGQIIASGIAIPFGRVSSNYAFRSPILLQAAPAAVNAAFILAFPESPRWLYANGMTERATAVLADLHSRTRDIRSPLIKLEIAEIQETISLQGGDKRWWDARPLFNTRSARYRTGMGWIVAIWQTLAGNGLVTCEISVKHLN